jgi:amino acid transporter
MQTPSGGQTIWPRMEYLRPGPTSWLSIIPSVARQMGIGHAPSGTSVAYVVVAVMIAISLLASRLVLTELGRPVPSQRRWRLPRAAWVCAVVACLNAACWSVLTPPFQAEDEPSHFAYVQYLAETGKLPKSSHYEFSQEEETVLVDLNQSEVHWHPEIKTISSQAAQLRLRHDLALPLGRVGEGAGVATSEPPLYYALETIPYYLGSGATLLDRLELMRLLSALLAGLTAMFTFLFVRELLPRVPFA